MSFAPFSRLVAGLAAPGVTLAGSTRQRAPKS
jgi:hypothetical protein